MTTGQKVIKYCAIAFAVFLIVSIVAAVTGAVAGVSYWFGDRKGEASGKMQTHNIGEKITALDIDIGAAELTVATGDSLSVESDSKDVTVRTENGTLIIQEESRWHLFGSRHAAVRLTLPKDAEFASIKLNTGAGRVSVDTLTADDISLNLGAGEVRIGTLNAGKRVEIDSGAGQLTVGGGEMNDADIDLGVGQAVITARLTGKCKLEYGVGECRLNLIGTRDDYRISLDRGPGSATVDGNSLADGAQYGNGTTEVEIDGGIGALTVRFVEQ